MIPHIYKTKPKKMIRCLAIDDDPLFLKILAAYFREIKSAELISTYSNSVEGIMAIVKEKPDVLLLDFEMPYLDGIEALETLEKRPKVIMISGYLDAPVATNFPIDAFISKVDLKSSELLEAIIRKVTSVL
ncbi:MAG: two-component system LytT family response regulator [Marinoscillum sp.]